MAGTTSNSHQQHHHHHHHSNSNNGIRSRTFHVLKNILSLLFDSLFNSIHKLISFMYTTRVLYESAPLTKWSKGRLTSMRKKTLILDLDETLIHSKQADQYGRQLNRAADSSIVTQEFGNSSLNFRSDSGLIMSVYNTLSQLFNKQPPKTDKKDKPSDRSISTIVLQVPGMLCQFLHLILHLSYRQVMSIYSYFNSSYAYQQIKNNPNHRRFQQSSSSSSSASSSSSYSKLTKPDFILPLVMHRERVNFLVRKRPHVDYFLQQTAQWYDLVIYTASLELYGSAVIDMLEKDAKVNFKGRYYRQDCIQEGIQSYTKDLRVVNEDLSSSFIIDNSPNAFRYFQDNAIHIHAFVGAADDDHLLRLLPMLDCLRFCSDVRNILSRRNPK